MVQIFVTSNLSIQICSIDTRDERNGGTHFLQYWKVFKTEKNGRQIHYETYYYSIYPEPLSSRTRTPTLVYLQFHGGYLSKSNPLCLFKEI